MQQAMQMMQGMDPQQLQQMMGSMGNMNPAMMQQAQAMARNMTPEDWERARAQMQGMSPEQLRQQAAAAQQHMSSQERYMLSAGQRLKAEGNQLHSAGSYQAALEKYERAKNNVRAFIGNHEALALFKACSLNLSSCYLNLKQYSSCVVQCDEVLEGEPNSLKALYRRGQARLGLSQWVAAAQDLERAAQLSASDPEQQRTILARLKEAQAKAASEPQTAAAAAAAAVTNAGSEDTSDDVTEGRAGVSAAVTGCSGQGSSSAEMSQTQDIAAAAVASAMHDAAGSSASSSARAANPMMSPEMMRNAAEMMRKNPEWAQQAQAMMRNMSDEQLQQLGRSMGQPVTREMLERGQQHLAGLRPEEMDRLEKLHQTFPAELRERLRANPHDPQAMAEATRLMQANPSMISEVSNMISKMDPDQLAQMARDSGAPVSPEMARMAAESFKTMPPDQIQAMAAQAAQRQGRTAPPPPSQPSASTPSAVISNSAAAPPQQQQLQQQQQQQQPATAGSSPSNFPMPGGAGGMPEITPEMAKMASEMMRNMPPEQLQAMMESMGGSTAGVPQMSPEMIKMASSMMSSMSPEDMARMSSMMGQGGPPGAAVPSASGAAQGAGGAPRAPAGFPGFGGAGGGPDMKNMDPAMIEQAIKMMRSMDEGTMVSMLEGSGMVKSREQAEAMAKQMRGMSDTQMNIMLKVATTAQKGARVYAKARAFLASRAALVIAILVLLLAFLLRWLGYM